MTIAFFESVLSGSTELMRICPGKSSYSQGPPTLISFEPVQLLKSSIKINRADSGSLYVFMESIELFLIGIVKKNGDHFLFRILNLTDFFSVDKALVYEVVCLTE